MADSTQRRRFISPAGLFLVLLCLFLPFFSVSCSTGFGEISVSATGMDQVFNGQPEISGFRPATQGQEPSRIGVSPLMVIALVAIVAGIGLGLGLRSPLARWASGAGASLLALLLVVVNQIAMHNKANQAFEEASSGLDGNPFGASFRPVFELNDEPGFWLVLVLLVALAGYNIAEVVWQRSPNRRPRFLAGDATTSPPPYPPGNWPSPPPPAQAPPQPGQWYPQGPPPRYYRQPPPPPPDQWYPPTPGPRDPQ